MLVASGNSYELTWPDALLAILVLVQISALDHDNPDIVGVSVLSGVKSGLELCVGSVSPHVGVSPDCRHGRTLPHFSELRLIGRSKDHFACLSLTVHPPDRPCHYECCCHTDYQ